MKAVLLYLWQLPQHLLALTLYLILKLSCKVINVNGNKFCSERVIRVENNFGVSLGNYIFLNTNHSDTVLQHERGHSKQSLVFGPLYLLVVGIPSVVFCNLWDKVFHKNWTDEKRKQWYYNRYPEKWADMLVGIKRWE